MYSPRAKRIGELYPVIADAVEVFDAPEWFIIDQSAENLRIDMRADGIYMI